MNCGSHDTGLLTSGSKGLMILGFEGLHLGIGIKSSS